MSSLRKSIPKMTMKRSGFDFVRKPVSEGGSMRATNARQQANEVRKEYEFVVNRLFRSVIR